MTSDTYTDTDTATYSPDDNKLRLYPTPADLAARMVSLAGIEEGMRVLEPSAGTGMLLGAMGHQMFGAMDCGVFGDSPERGEVVAVEINQTLATRLCRDFPLTGVYAADFLACNGNLGRFDRVVMNPPFANADDIKHIKHALGMLKPGGRIVAICANGPRQRAALEPLASCWEDLPPGTFAESGTGVNAALLVIDN